MEARKALRLGGYDYSAQGVYFLTLCTHNRRCILSRPTALIPRVIAALKRFTNREAGSKLWKTSYYDHIIRDEADYTVRYNYIRDNPARWAEDEYFIP